MTLLPFCLIGVLSMWLPEVISSETEIQGWMFTFPESISVLKNSDVTIPCSFTSPDNQSEVNVIWYRYQTRGYPQIFNSKDPSQVIPQYKGRTSLVVNGTGDCSLKITNVRDTDEFFPGISEKINSWDLNKKKHIKVQITGCSNPSQCWGWWFTLPFNIDALEGSCMDLRCTLSYPEDAGDFNFFWYKGRDVQIFNNKTQSDVHSMYKGRTLLTGDTRNNCSIRIDNIKKEDQGEYYAGVNTEINSNTLQDKTFTVSVSEKPPRPSLNVTKDVEEDKPVTIICSVIHVCASDPPTLTWNMAGHPITQESKYNERSRKFMAESIMVYTPYYTDNKRTLECAATFPNNKTTRITERLHIRYRPKEVTVSVVGDTETTGGDNVTLRCTSQANPQKTQYTWYQIRKSGRLLQGDGDTITVKNETTKQYICTATNAIGAGESPAFQLIGQSNNENDTVLYVLIGTAVVLVLVTILFILYCMITRMKRKMLVNGTDVGKKSTKAQEHIPLDDHLYGNVDHNQPKRDLAETRLSRPPDDSHIYGNTGVPQGGDINPSKGEVPEEPYGVVYTQIDLSALGDGRQHPITLENTQYATLKHA